MRVSKTTTRHSSTTSVLCTLISFSLSLYLYLSACTCALLTFCFDAFFCFTLSYIYIYLQINVKCAWCMQHIQEIWTKNNNGWKLRKMNKEMQHKTIIEWFPIFVYFFIEKGDYDLYQNSVYQVENTCHGVCSNDHTNKKETFSLALNIIK